MMVARDGVEPPTPAFSGFFWPKPFFNQQLNSSRWPQFCDHSVTSADVRLSVGVNYSGSQDKQKVSGDEASAVTGNSGSVKSELREGPKKRNYGFRSEWSRGTDKAVVWSPPACLPRSACSTLMCSKGA